MVLEVTKYFSTRCSHLERSDPPRYSWNIVESGVKHHKPSMVLLFFHLSCSCPIIIMEHYLIHMKFS